MKVLARVLDELGPKRKDILECDGQNIFKIVEKNLRLEYIEFFLDFITPAWQIQALVLGCVTFDERHTFFNIAEWMVKELYDWQMTPITEMIVSDTDSNQMGVFNDGIDLDF